MFTSFHLKFSNIFNLPRGAQTLAYNCVCAVSREFMLLIYVHDHAFDIMCETHRCNHLQMHFTSTSLSLKEKMVWIRVCVRAGTCVCTCVHAHAYSYLGEVYSILH